MKKNYKIALAFILGILVSGTSVYAATKYLASEVTYKDKTVEKALNELYNKSGSLCDESLIGTTWKFNYSGEEDVFVAPCNGTYKLEAWGAQGGSYSATYYGGYGGYSVGYAQLKQIEKIYINVGGKGSCEYAGGSTSNISKGGYNGGGNGTYITSNATTSNTSCSGGGATHIATKTGLLSSLEEYKGTYSEETGTYNSNTILIVSGGGGGSVYAQNNNSSWIANGGSGGGFEGSIAVLSPQDTSGTRYSYSASSSNQIDSGYIYYGVDDSNIPQKYTNGSFGLGGFRNGSGGGAGWYGGSGAAYAVGGSGFIGSSRLKSYNNFAKAMYCYNCEKSDKENTKTISTTNVSDKPTSNYAKKGHGYAKITLVSLK